MSDTGVYKYKGRTWEELMDSWIGSSMPIAGMSEPMVTRTTRSLIEADIAEQAKPQCPFADPTYVLDPTIPCPVCGAVGGMDMAGPTVEELCVD